MSKKTNSVDKKDLEITKGDTRARESAGEPEIEKMGLDECDLVSLQISHSDALKPLTSKDQIQEALMSGRIDLEKMVDCCIQGLTATRSFAIKGVGLHCEPDHASRLKYLEFITHTVEGLPVKRQETIHRKVTTEEDLILMARKSPALCRELIYQLNRAMKEEHGEDMLGAIETE